MRPMSGRGSAGLPLVVAALLSAGAQARIAAKPDLKLNFAVPDDFEPVKDVDPSLAYAFKKQLPDASLLITVGPLPGPVADEKLKLPSDTSKLEAALPGIQNPRFSVE